MPDGTTFSRRARADPSVEEVAAFAAAYGRSLPVAMSRYGVEGAVANTALLSDGSVRITLSADDGHMGREAVVFGGVDRFIFLRGGWDGDKRVEGHDPDELAHRLGMALERLGGRLQKAPPASVGRRSPLNPVSSARLVPLAEAATAALMEGGLVGVRATLNAASSEDGMAQWGEIGLLVPGSGALPILLEVHERPVYGVSVLHEGEQIHVTTYDHPSFAAGFAAFYWHFDRHGPIGGTGPTPLERRRVSESVSPVRGKGNMSTITAFLTVPSTA